MTVSVAASDLQKDFDHWHEQAMREPVQITSQGRETAYLLSAAVFHELWAGFARGGTVSPLSDEEMAMILDAEVPAGHADADAPTP
ncbi:type II toxin-antitoxin system Phd/YefM family antitoxin [Methylobacterium sp. NEAU 140]|uniref:type II toxin-antitoxin system Phd/YefM family antitoxin n=1 Tax=Methylobacterium sp. NEAU 140 TaxID=3064945 RepID=UPI002735667D|nr:type II toxin-antitoxin system Phd/YefM family antitoxin [Methylobacterium sp. NEAU 140]MDP4022355.1 type II toxin-antitoxin system Phd/YefM family antitoxin [Methylobacterium sp. NEAU 140]